MCVRCYCWGFEDEYGRTPWPEEDPGGEEGQEHGQSRWCGGESSTRATRQQHATQSVWDVLVVLLPLVLATLSSIGWEGSGRGTKTRAGRAGVRTKVGEEEEARPRGQHDSAAPPQALQLLGKVVRWCWRWRRGLVGLLRS